MQSLVQTLYLSWVSSSWFMLTGLNSHSWINNYSEKTVIELCLSNDLSHVLQNSASQPAHRKLDSVCWT